MYRMNIWRVICFTKWLQLLIRSNQRSKLQSKRSLWYEKFKRREINCSKHFQNKWNKKIIMAKSVFFSLSTLLRYDDDIICTQKHEIHASRSRYVYSHIIWFNIYGLNVCSNVSQRHTAIWFFFLLFWCFEWNLSFGRISWARKISQATDKVVSSYVCEVRSK